MISQKSSDGTTWFAESDGEFWTDGTMVKARSDLDLVGTAHRVILEWLRGRELREVLARGVIVAEVPRDRVAEIVDAYERASGRRT